MTFLSCGLVIIVLFRTDVAVVSYSLASNKRRVIVKSGEIFLNPCLLYAELKSGQKTSKKRYTTKVRQRSQGVVIVATVHHIHK